MEIKSVTVRPLFEMFSIRKDCTVVQNSAILSTSTWFKSQFARHSSVNVWMYLPRSTMPYVNRSVPIACLVWGNMGSYKINCVSFSQLSPSKKPEMALIASAPISLWIMPITCGPQVNSLRVLNSKAVPSFWILLFCKTSWLSEFGMKEGSCSAKVLKMSLPMW